MKEKLVLMAILVTTVFPAWAGDSTQQLPEPSTIGLFAAAAIAITVLTKLRK
ncbi:MAG: PEP-CTERM sorting domain-containing protein [Pseudomonadales bacterium]|nr:PEP-CTERM sorting domain-containing protein [Pseudomonadales bacterium]